MDQQVSFGATGSSLVIRLKGWKLHLTVQQPAA